MESVYEEDAAENEGIRQFGVEDAQRYIASFRVNEVVSTLIRNNADYLHQIFGHLKNQHFSYAFFLMSHWFKNEKKGWTSDSPLTSLKQCRILSSFK